MFSRPLRFLSFLSLLAGLGLLCLGSYAPAQSDTTNDAQASTPVEWIVVSEDQRSFQTELSKEPFVSWGYNYDHDPTGRLLEAYWDDAETVNLHLKRMADSGAKVIRIHLQVSAFLVSPNEANADSIERLKRLVQDAKALGLRLNLTGLGCYHKGEVPAWYDELSREERWNAQAFFWQSIALAVRDEPTVFCFDLMNEPVVPGGPREAGEWLGPPFGDKSFVQFISLDVEGRTRPEMAKAWIDHLVKAIREVDSRHLITVGLVPWSLDRPGLTSGFVPELTCQSLDFVSVHIYPESGKLEENAEVLKGFAIGKPLVVEEFFPLQCNFDEALGFIEQHQELVAGWVSFHWGASQEELNASGTLSDAIVAQWISKFSEAQANR